MDKTTTHGPVEGNDEVGNDIRSGQNPESCKQQTFPSTSETTEKTMSVRKNYKRAANRGRKCSQVSAGREYSLRSSHSNARVLHPLSTAKNSPSEFAQIPVQPVAKKTRDRCANKCPKNEFTKIHQQIRYILNRMNYEQSLLEAYASEGWKRQSLEKIRPEKELERAKAEILRCKSRIREAFQNLDHLLSEGNLEESLFDSEGEISSEDIFCATCGSKDVTLSNDIILCDGACDRGFHQNCLNPPLLAKDIPAGDEGWLCPACDCKIECIDILNELQGTNLSISDSWEKVFPEAVAFTNGPKHNDLFDLPSDDSEDNDFDPNMAEECVASQVEGSSEEDGDEGSDSDDSNFVTSSDDSEPLKDKENVDDLGLPSEDSEDDDYDPAGPDSEDTQKKPSNSDLSDFTSDSDDFCAEIAKSCDQDEVTLGSKSGDPSHDLEGTTVRVNTENSNPISKDFEMNQNVVLPVSGRREVQRLDYKKLYDEAYGEASSDSSDGKEWLGESTPNIEDAEQSEADYFEGDDLSPQTAEQSLQPDARHGSVGWQHAGQLTSNGSNSTTQKRQFGPIIRQRLREHFEIDQYPRRAIKESLAQELGLTFHQVSKWFDSTRHSTRVAATKKGAPLENIRTKRNKSFVVASMPVTDLKENETPGNLNEVIQNGSPVKQDITSGQRTLVTPPENNEANITSGLIACPTSGSTENHGKNTFSRECSEYKQLYDDAYGEASSHSSDGEEFILESTLKIKNAEQSEANSFSCKSSRRTGAVHRGDDLSLQTAQESLQHDARRGSVGWQRAGQLASNGSNSTKKRQFGPIIKQRLYEHFEIDQYPSRAIKESLAQELGLTFLQVSKWFESTRRFTRVDATKKGTPLENISTKRNKSSLVANMPVTDSKENEKMTSGNLNSVVQNGSPVKQDITSGQRTLDTPPENNQANITSGLIVRPTSGSTENNGKTTLSREVGKPDDNPAEDQNLGPEQDEGRKEAILHELKRRKTDR